MCMVIVHKEDTRSTPEFDDWIEGYIFPSQSSDIPPTRISLHQGLMRHVCLRRNTRTCAKLAALTAPLVLWAYLLSPASDHVTWYETPRQASSSCHLSLTDMASSSQHISRLSRGGHLPCGDVHLMMAGHSRLRQLYRRAVTRLRLKRRTRGDRPRLPFADTDALGDAATVSLQDNSTCLAGFHHPNRSHDWWCSEAAAAPSCLLQLRWRRDSRPLWQLLDQLLVVERRQLPDVLLLTHGLYMLILTQDRFEPWPQLEQLRSQLVVAGERLRELASRGVRVIWMLEHHVNSMKQFDWSTLDYRLSIVNTMVLERLLQVGVHVWTAHHAITVDWVNRICRYGPWKSEDTADACQNEFFHLDEATLDLLLDQLWPLMSANCRL